MGKKLLTLLLMIVLSLSLASALTYKQNSDVDIRHSVRLNNAPTSSADCNVTVYDPNRMVLVYFQPMTYSSTSETYNYTVPYTNTSLLGTYPYDITCLDSGQNETYSDEFEITPTGNILTTSEGMMYLLLLAVVLGLFGLSLFGAVKIPSKHKRNEFDEIIEINWMKYSKYFLWGISYLFFMWIIFLAWNLSYGYLHLGAMATAFHYLFKLMYAITIPVFIFIGIIAILNYTNDRRMQKYFDMGVSSLSP